MAIISACNVAAALADIGDGGVAFWLMRRDSSVSLEIAAIIACACREWRGLVLPVAGERRNDQHAYWRAEKA